MVKLRIRFYQRVGGSFITYKTFQTIITFLYRTFREGVEFRGQSEGRW